MKEKLTSDEELILLAIRYLGSDAYGSLIRDTIKQLCNRSLTVASLYVTIERLEKHGLIKVELREATEKRADKRRAYCQLTGLGERSLEAAEAARAQLRCGEMT